MGPPLTNAGRPRNDLPSTSALDSLGGERLDGAHTDPFGCSYSHGGPTVGRPRLPMRTDSDSGSRMDADSTDGPASRDNHTSLCDEWCHTFQTQWEHMGGRSSPIARLSTRLLRRSAVSRTDVLGRRRGR